MANEQQDRVDAEQKEEARPVIPTTSETNIFTNDADSEFATDTWMGAVLNPDATRPRQNNASYPNQRADQFGEPGAAGDDPQPTGAVRTIEEQKADQADRANRVADSAAERTDVRQADYETASEIAPPVRTDATETDRERAGQQVDAPQEDVAGVGNGLGWIGLGVSILSLFFLPYLLGPAGIVLGYLAYRQNARTLGIWAMVAGTLGILGALLLYPFLNAR